MIPPELLARVSADAARDAVARVTNTAAHPGDVVSADPSSPTVVRVHMDSDPDGTSIPVQSTGDLPRIGDRVIVLLIPGGGSYLLGPAPPVVHTVGAADEPSFAAGWTNYATTWRPAGFWRDRLGVVHLLGEVKKTSALVLPDRIFTLPAGYRPAYSEQWAVASNATLGNVNVHASGVVEVANVGSNGNVSLAGITFLGDGS